MFLDPKIIKNHVGSTYFERGKRYYLAGAVLKVECVEEEYMWGKVLGSGRQAYEVNIRFSGSKIVDSRCACPVAYACKHVAALYLKAISVFPQLFMASPDPDTIQLPSTRQSAPIPQWKRALETLLERPREEKKQNRLEIAMGLQEARSFGTDLQIPPVMVLRPKLFEQLKGKSSFSGVKWKDIRYPESLGIPENQTAFFRRLVNALYDYYMEGSGWAQIHPDKAFDVWATLKEASQYGVRLVIGEKKDEKTITVSDHPLEAGIELKESKGQWKLSLEFMLNGEVLAPGSYFPVGAPPSFALARKFADGNQSFSLHPVIIPNAPALRTLKNELSIPEAEVENFKKNYLPRLRQRYPLKSASPKIQIPELPPCRMAIKVKKISPLSLELTPAFRYGENEVSPGKDEIMTDSNGNTFYRDLEKENELLEKTDASLRILPLFQKTGPRTLLTEATVLEKIDAALFVKDILPALEKLDVVEVERDPDVPNFSFHEASPEVEFTVEENSENPDWFDLNVMVSVQGEKIEFQKVFEALSKDEKFLFLESGRYFSLEHPAFEKLKQLILEARKIRDSNKNGLSLSRFQASLWEELKALGIVGKQAEAWEKSMRGLLNFKNLKIPAVPKNFRASLREYQQDGFSWLKFLHENRLGGVLADDMGLGKTIQTIALICSLKGKATGKSKAVKPFLVIAPTSVVENWEHEFEKFAPKLKVAVMRKGDRSDQHKKIKNYDVVVSSYALVHRDLDVLKPVEFEAIILDEAQFVKNHQAKIYGDIRRLRAPVKIALTGTPMENNLMELWSIFSITCPGLFPSPENFNDLYRKPIEKQADRDVLQRLRARIRPFMLRRKKELVASELPPKMEQTLFLEMNPKHRAVYELHLQRERQRVLGMLKEGGLKNHRFEILSALTKMRQLCLHPGLVDKKYAKLPATKLEALEEQIRTLVDEGHRALVFSQFTGFLAEVKKMLDGTGVPYLYLDGGTSNRREVIRDFKSKNGPPVFLISLKAGGFGLNLTEADYCIMLDPWWNPAAESQAIDRTHRIGQDKSVFVYKMIAKNTVEEKVLKLQEKKKQLFRNVLEDGDIFGSLVTEEDIQKIFE